MAQRQIDPEQTVLSCKYIESGIRFAIDGVRCCCANTFQSPFILSAEEMQQGNVTYDLVVQRRRELFEALNGWNNKDIGDCARCQLKYKTKYKNINFDYLGGHGLALSSGFNIQHFTQCNLRCSYCSFTQRNDFRPPVYNNIIDFIELFRKRGKLKKGEWIEYNGGEPTLLPNFEELLNYLLKYKIGTVAVFSNAVKYSPAIYNALKANKIFLTTSIDAGTSATFKKIRGADAYYQVLENCMRYQQSGTTKLFLKYIICDENTTEDDLRGFVFAMCTIRPARVYICPNFYYGDRQVTQKEVDFAARMWYLLEKYGSLSVYIQSDDMKGDPRFAEFSVRTREAYKQLIAQDESRFCSLPKFYLMWRKFRFYINFAKGANLFKLIRLKLEKMRKNNGK